MATPQTIEMEWDSVTAIGTPVISQLRGVYRNNVRVRDVLIWNGSATTTSGGNLIVNLTTDGTAAGPSLFSEVLSISALHQLNTTNTANGCFVMLRGYTAGLKQAAFLVITGTNLGLGGQTTVPAGTGQLVQVTVIGLPAA